MACHDRKGQEAAVTINCDTQQEKPAEEDVCRHKNVNQVSVEKLRETLLRDLMPAQFFDGFISQM
jgi:hypothetical protein